MDNTKTIPQDALVEQVNDFDWLLSDETRGKYKLTASHWLNDPFTGEQIKDSVTYGYYHTEAEVQAAINRITTPTERWTEDGLHISPFWGCPMSEVDFRISIPAPSDEELIEEFDFLK